MKLFYINIINVYENDCLGKKVKCMYLLFILVKVYGRRLYYLGWGLVEVWGEKLVISFILFFLLYIFNDYVVSGKGDINWIYYFLYVFIIL